MRGGGGGGDGICFSCLWHSSHFQWMVDISIGKKHKKQQQQQLIQMRINVCCHVGTIRFC